MSIPQQVIKLILQAANGAGLARFVTEPEVGEEPPEDEEVEGVTQGM